VLADPTRVWTPEDQVRLTMEYADPFGAPGQAFRYSDTGYVLVGDIVERLTHLDLAAAARRELKLDRLGLTATWWEIFEPAPSGAAPRARQYLGDIELTNIHPSIDLYGGGGLVMSARDITTFFSALFEGRIYDRRQTLHEMLRQGRHVGAEQYRLGMFVRRVGGQELYCHGGVWGAMACYSPATKRTAAGVTTSRDGCEALIAIVDAAASRPASGADK
jgi:Beta-lactamase class C and other penicillin binding proteins